MSSRSEQPLVSSLADQQANPISRTINPASPVWAPFALNVGILLVAFGYRLYTFTPKPSVQRLGQHISNSKGEINANNVSSLATSIRNR